MNPEKKQTTGAKDNCLVGHFCEGHNFKEGTYLDSCSSLALTLIPSFNKHYQQPFPTLSSAHQRPNTAEKTSKQN